MKWFTRLKDGLLRSTEKITTGLSDVFTKAKLEAGDLDTLEEALILADFGPRAAVKIREHIASKRFEKGMSREALMHALADQVAEMLAPVEIPLEVVASPDPQAVLIVGVNGSGKTTTIAKLAHQYAAAGRKVLLVAGDTFRAAAVEQLRIWAERTHCGFIHAKPSGDAAGLVFDAVKKAEAEGYDLLLIDTAGRLHTKHNLMQELEKIVRVMKKAHAEMPQHTVLVLDGGTGQNALVQLKAFNDCVPISGLVVTKLDGTAKAGIVVALAEQFGLPIHAVGVGEKANDLDQFSAKQFANAMFLEEGEA